MNADRGQAFQFCYWAWSGFVTVGFPEPSVDLKHPTLETLLQPASSTGGSSHLVLTAV